MPPSIYRLNNLEQWSQIFYGVVFLFSELIFLVVKHGLGLQEHSSRSKIRFQKSLDLVVLINKKTMLMNTVDHAFSASMFRVHALDIYFIAYLLKYSIESGINLEVRLLIFEVFYRCYVVIKGG